MKKIIALFVSVCLLLVFCACSGSGDVSGSDAPDVVEIPEEWDLAASDDEYLAMMQEKVNEYIICMTSLSSMEKRLALLGDEQKIADDVQFCEVTDQLYDWCEGALGYPEEMLINDSAKSVCMQIQELAGATVIYLDNLPAMLAGTYTGELSADDYKNSIADSAVAVFEMLNSQNEE